MKKILISSLLFLFSRFVNAGTSQTSRADTTQLQISKMYVKGIESLRLLFITLFGMGICLVFLLSAIILFHVVVFVYMPWSVQTKISIGLWCSLFYFLTAIGSFAYVFEQ